MKNKITKKIITRIRIIFLLVNLASVGAFAEESTLSDLNILIKNTEILRGEIESTILAKFSKDNTQLLRSSIVVDATKATKALQIIEVNNLKSSNCLYEATQLVLQASRSNKSFSPTEFTIFKNKVKEYLKDIRNLKAIQASLVIDEPQKAFSLMSFINAKKDFALTEKIRIDKWNYNPEKLMKAECAANEEAALNELKKTTISFEGNLLELAN
jgi:hypothetical protein